MDVSDVSLIEKGLVYAIIPARSGSKGVVNKNIRMIGGHPLMAYSIVAGKMCSQISRVIVSTDSKEYANIALEYGAEVPFIRPKEISGDNSTDLEFMEHAINWFIVNEKKIPEYWVHLRATCPIRRAEIINSAIEKIKNNDEATSLLSVCIPEGIPTPYKWMIRDGEYIKSIFFDNNDDANMPRQSYPTAYMRSIYADILKSQTIIEEHCLFGPRIIPFQTEMTDDIDEERDFRAVMEKIYEETPDMITYLDSLKR